MEGGSRVLTSWVALQEDMFDSGDDEDEESGGSASDGEPVVAAAAAAARKRTAVAGRPKLHTTRGGKEGSGTRGVETEMTVEVPKVKPEQK